MTVLKKIVVGFGRFWWDFLVGDTPEIFLMVLAVAGAIALISVVAGAHAAGWVILPVLVVSTLIVTVSRAARK